MYGSFNHSVDCSSSCKHVGFLQKNNSLDESGRILRSFKDGAAKNLLSCDNGEPRFRRSETDFSNLFARGRPRKAKKKPYLVNVLLAKNQKSRYLSVSLLTVLVV